MIPLMLKYLFIEITILMLFLGCQSKNCVSKEDIKDSNLNLYENENDKDTTSVLDQVFNNDDIKYRAYRFASHF